MWSPKAIVPYMTNKDCVWFKNQHRRGSSHGVEDKGVV